MGSGCVWCGVISGLAAAVTDEGVLMTSALLWASATSGVNGLAGVPGASSGCAVVSCAEVSFVKTVGFSAGNTVDGASVTLGVLSKPGNIAKGRSGLR